MAVLASLVSVIGCSNDERLVKQAEVNAKRQAEQNEEMARLNREVAEGSKRLVQANAEASDKLLMWPNTTWTRNVVRSTPNAGRSPMNGIGSRC